MTLVLASHHIHTLLRHGTHGTGGHSVIVIVGLVAIAAFVVVAKLRQGVGG